jgi:hypothetical protein
MTARFTPFFKISGVHSRSHVFRLATAHTISHERANLAWKSRKDIDDLDTRVMERADHISEALPSSIWFSRLA